MIRIRVTFSKTEAMRYTSHLDLQRTWERTIRRAGLPLSYSQGFNPRPKLNLAAALPLGITSQCELLDVWLDQEMDLEEILSVLRNAAPPGIEIHNVDQVNLNTPKLPVLLDSVEYSIIILDFKPKLSKKIKDLLTSSSVIRIRRGKQYDLRPLINTIEEMQENHSGKQRIRVSLKNQPGQTGRPDEVMHSLDINPINTLIHRTKIILKK
jgi:radical SAM-linked protein